MRRLVLPLALLACVVATTAQQGMGPGPGVKSYSAAGPLVSDTFTAGSDVAITSHAADTCTSCATPNYVLHPSYSGTITVDATLDRAYLTSAAAAAVYVDVTPASANYCVGWDVRRVTQIANNASVSIGLSTSADTGILLRANDTGAAFQWEVLDRVSGSNGTPVTSVSNAPSVGGASVTVEMCRSGTAITVTVNGSPDAALNFTTGITATGRPGMRISGQATSTTGIHVDNFHAQ